MKVSTDLNGTAWYNKISINYEKEKKALRACTAEQEVNVQSEKIHLCIHCHCPPTQPIKV